METDRVHVPSTTERNDGAWSVPHAGGLDTLQLEPARLDVDGIGPGPTERSGGRSKRPGRRHRPVAYAVELLVLAAALVTAVDLHAQLGRTNGSLTSTRAELHRTIGQVAVAREELATVSDQSNAAARTLETETVQLAADQQQLSDAEASIHAKGVSISDLVTCLSGVERALNQISLGNQSGAATTLNGVSSSCRSARPSG